MQLRHFTFLTILAIAMTATVNARADSTTGLYRSPVPPGFGLVRIFNAGTPIPAGIARLGERPLKSMATGELSVYLSAPAGPRTVSCGKKSMSINIEDGRFYTYVCGGIHEGVAIRDPQPENLNKTFLILYNLSQNIPVKLMTANGKVTVIDSVPSSGIGNREINPVRVELSIFDGQNQSVFNLGQISFAPEKIYNVFVTQIAGEIRAYFRESLIANEQ